MLAAMSRSPLILGAVLAAAALVAGAPASAAVSAKRVSTDRHPGGIVVRHERVTIDGRTSNVTTVTMPKPGRGRALEPYLPRNRVSSGTTTTSGITGELKDFGTAVAVNADLFEYASGQPSGLFMVDGEMYNQPQGGRPALFMGVDGTLGMTTPKSSGTLRVGRRKVPFEVNVRRDDGVVLYDFGWGPQIPPGAKHAFVGRIEAFQVYQRPREWDLETTLRVTRARPGALPVPKASSSTFLLAGYGPAAKALAAAKRGARVRMKYTFGPLPGETRHGVGGGPILVEDGKVVYQRARYREFSDSQLVPPDARTAVGQMPDGRVVFYAVDQGSGSAGFTVPEVARDLQRRGVERAMAFDSGGSTAVSINGRLLNAPSDGRERPVGNVLVYFRPKEGYRNPIRWVRVGRVDPGKRVPRLSFSLRGKVGVEVFLHAPDGASHFVADERLKAGRHTVRVPKRLLKTGRWELEVAVPDYQDRIIKRFTVRRHPKAEPAAAEATDPVVEDAPAAERAEAGGDGGGSSVGWIAAGAAIVVLAGVAVALGARRRRG